MNYKEYLKRRLMEETINEITLTDAQRQDPNLGFIEHSHATLVQVLMHLFNENPHIFQSENARGRLINLANRLGMNVGSRFDNSIEKERERGISFPDNPLPIYYHNPSGSRPTEVSVETPIPLTGRTQQEREYAERIGRHETRVRNKIRARNSTT